MTSKDLIAFRKKLHEHPELSGSEYETAKSIKKFIQASHPTSIIENIGGCGLAAVYEYSSSGPTIAIRCELDALPIAEKNNFSHKSKTDGVSHKCGHDGHMAIVSGIGFRLNELSLQSGKVILLFQPAEETGTGAQSIIEDPKFQNLNIDYLFALHNIPGQSLHDILLMPTGFSAEVISFCMSITGKESHAAEPENGINPAIGLSRIVSSLSRLNISNPDDDLFAILTPIHINMGQKSYGISPAKAELHYTIRTWNQENMAILKSQIERLAKKICEEYQLAFEIHWFEHFPASINDPLPNLHVADAAKVNGFNLIEQSYPFKFGEDFGCFSKRYRTAMFGLGAGEKTPALHSADYDFPDQLIGTGIKMFLAIISSLLTANK